MSPFPSEQGNKMAESINSSTYATAEKELLATERSAASQEVLQSNSGSVRETYQNIPGPQNIHALASAKDTGAELAASNGHGHRRVVKLYKTGEELGIILLGGRKLNSPIFISRILPDGVADNQGGLKPGDQLLSINGVCVENESHKKAIELLKHAKGSLKLQVKYTPKYFEEWTMKFNDQCDAQKKQKQ